ncbi:GGDEF domain-containing protein [Brevibacillus ginsengisoli]|uniref:GGDEF domain-containing protein n=1 Tax=Brevibacillus ginsengisoli TaxID=363854 RepID=UPI003CEE5EBF
MLYSNQYLLFSTMVLIGFGLLHMFLRYQVKGCSLSDQKKIFRYLPIGILGATVAFLTVGYILTVHVEEKEREELTEIITGFASTFSKELEQEGHYLLTSDTPQNSLTYQNLMKKTKMWTLFSNKIQCMYTLRKSTDGRNYFVISPETDYDHNGIIRGKREALSPIGKIYDNYIPELEDAFRGITSIEPTPTRDEFSYSIGAFTPIYHDGKIDAVLGIDFDGEIWDKTMAHAHFLVKSYTLVPILLLFMAYWMIVYQRRISVILTQLAHYDHLTSLPNRLLFEKTIQNLLSIGQQKNQPFTVILLDVNRFKKINDTYGHLVGDQLLQKVSERFIHCFGNKENIFRLSGDEFIILLPNQNNAESRNIIQKIEEILSFPILLDEQVLQVTASIGVSEYPTDGQNMEALIRQADIRMYKNKALIKEELESIEKET